MCARKTRHNFRSGELLLLYDTTGLSLRRRVHVSTECHVFTCRVESHCAGAWRGARRMGGKSARGVNVCASRLVSAGRGWRSVFCCWAFACAPPALRLRCWARGSSHSRCQTPRADGGRYRERQATYGVCAWRTQKVSKVSARLFVRCCKG